jgi:predicted HAD superfamily Cof-like phosphohydrolase
VPAKIDPVVALRESHRAQGLVTNAYPTLDVPAQIKELRCALIEEEAAEFRAALTADDIVGVADAIGDLLYVVYGAAATFGIPVEEVFAEIHRSNMTKVDAQGRVSYRADGKVLKGEAFNPPNIGPILAKCAVDTEDVHGSAQLELSRNAALAGARRLGVALSRALGIWRDRRP